MPARADIIEPTESPPERTEMAEVYSPYRTVHGDDALLERGRTDADTSLPRKFNLYSSMRSQICWFNQLKESRSVSYHLNLILAHNHSHRFTSARLKNRPLSLLEVVLAGGNKLPSGLYPSTENVDLLWQSCQFTVNKINQKLYPFVALKDMEPHHQVTVPKASKSGKDKTEYEQINYADLLPFANRALVPVHPRFIDFLVSIPEGIELLNRDCHCEDSAFEPDENGKFVCKCTLSDRLKWHEKRIKKLLCASVFEHRFLLPSVNDIRPFYKKYVQLIESSMELCHLADLVEGDEQVVHITIAQGSSSSRGIVKASTKPSARTQTRTQTVTSRGASVPWYMEGSWGRKEGWFPREWVDEFSREQKGPWERFWGIFTSPSGKKQRSGEILSVGRQNQQGVDKGRSKVKGKKILEGKKVETKVLMEADTSMKKGNASRTTTRSTEREGRGEEQLDVPVDSRPPPPPYQADRRRDE
ncbi:hypothetical protein QBC32DRAFT_385893 [Pseudoneurospora amorphoporcata]|uniref:Uncharacterized protein n=1 Tax=Pseudoneurospora amorphoporcata TaxID=241081 RepID=A0AAN6NXS2_9PEZI|nr:hypothetical protein QBC32DRAFT_385893 [Pseudoneurospora amorphoporcata]